MKQHEFECVREMLSGAPGLRSTAIAKYLDTADQWCKMAGVDFSAIVALDDLIKYASLLRDEISTASDNA